MEDGQYVYILECADKTYYTGYTTNVERRLRVHNEGKGAKYTKYRRPCKIVYYESFSDKSLAMRREYQIKQLSRKEKKELIVAKLKEL